MYRIKQNEELKLLLAARSMPSDAATRHAVDEKYVSTEDVRDMT